ncbi:hypothetical protein CK203_065198 [Vitis vinifera]|uniref:Uncharacterized protein n=1 Tax=Vitis vinifera TaxID=29760 RepID=A0A438G5E1_VITVI|nr:hypothetical protein CK203_065198 [Vitis vinifera]
MMGWDGEAPQPISLYEDSNFSGYIHGQQVPRPFRLILDEIPRQTTVSSMLERMFRKRMMRYCASCAPHRLAYPFGGLLASSSTHRDALIRALSQIRVDTATTIEGLIHFLTANRATCIVFSDDDLPPKGSDHVRPLFIDVACSVVGCCHLCRPSEHMTGLKGQLWPPLDSRGGVIPSSLHQKVKFIHERRIIMIQFNRDIVTSSEPMLQISHSEDDLHLTGFTFDEGPREFAFTIDHDIPYGLGYTPFEEDARHMARLRRDRRIEHAPCTEGVNRVPEQALGQWSVRLCGPTSFFDTMSSTHTHVCNVDDVGDTDDPLSGQSECDSDSDMEDRKVTPISGSTELIDFGAPDQPRELRIGSSLSPDERSRLIDLLRSYLDVKEEIQKQLSVGFLSVVEYPEWLANVVHVPKKDGKILMALEDMEKTSFITEWGTYCYRVMPFGLKNARATYQRAAATTLFHDMMHKDVEVYVDDMIVKSRYKADHLAALRRFFERIDSSVQLNDSEKERAIYYLSKRMLEYECRYIMIEHLCLALVWATKRLRHYVTEYSILLDSDCTLMVPPINQVWYRYPIDITSVRRAYKSRDYARPWSQTVGDPRGFQLVIQQTQGIWRTRDEKLKPYHAYLDLLADRSAPAYCCLIGDIEDQDELSYHDIYQFLLCGAYPKSASTKDRRTLRQLATRFVICGESLYRRSPEGLLLLCLDHASADRVMREIVASSFKGALESRCTVISFTCHLRSCMHSHPLGHFQCGWVETASYARLTTTRVAKFIRSMAFNITDRLRTGRRLMGH